MCLLLGGLIVGEGWGLFWVGVFVLGRVVFLSSDILVCGGGLGFDFSIG